MITYIFDDYLDSFLNFSTYPININIHPNIPQSDDIFVALQNEGFVFSKHVRFYHTMPLKRNSNFKECNIIIFIFMVKKNFQKSSKSLLLKWPRVYFSTSRWEILDQNLERFNQCFWFMSIICNFKLVSKFVLISGNFKV